jgi:hypothetical protein
MNTRLLRKVERLESRVSPMRRPEPGNAVVNTALARLSMEDLDLLASAFEGQHPGKELVAERVAAGERLSTALEAECLRAGFKSLAEFHRLHPATMPRTGFRMVGRTHWK